MNIGCKLDLQFHIKKKVFFRQVNLGNTEKQSKYISLLQDFQVTLIHQLYTVNLIEEGMIHSVSMYYSATEYFFNYHFEDNNFYIITIMIINQCY